jgi:hypothetical protein
VHLSVINSGNLAKGTELHIFTDGIIDSLRNMKDGYTYFGCKKNNNGKIVNDFVIPVSEKTLSD